MTGLLGAVLAGGRSRRFGSDKAQALFGEMPLIERAIAGLRPQVAAMVVCGRASDDPHGIEDRPTGGLGPLAGLNAALRFARDRGFAGIVTTPCDVVTLPDNLVATLQAAGPAAFARGLPVIGLWPTSFADLLDEHLATTCDLSLRCWIRACGATPCEIAPIANINTREDLAAASLARG